MKTKVQPESESSRPDLQNEASAGSIVTHRRQAGTPLTEDERQQLRALAEMSDDDIDFSGIPRSTEEQLRQFVHGPWTPLIDRTITLRLDDEVAEWLETASAKDARMINRVLKQRAQEYKRSQAADEATQIVLHKAS